MGYSRARDVIKEHCFPWSWTTLYQPIICRGGREVLCGIKVEVIEKVPLLITNLTNSIPISVMLALG